MTTHCAEFHNRRCIVAKHANVSSRLLYNIAVGNKLVWVFGILELVTAVTLEVKEEVAAVGLSDGDTTEERVSATGVCDFVVEERFSGCTVQNGCLDKEKIEMVQIMTYRKMAVEV